MLKNYLHKNLLGTHVFLLLVALLGGMATSLHAQQGVAYDSYFVGNGDMELQVLRPGETLLGGTAVPLAGAHLEEVLRAAEYISQFVSHGYRATQFGYVTGIDSNGIGWVGAPGMVVSTDYVTALLKHPAVQNGTALFKTTVHEFGHNLGIISGTDVGDLAKTINHGRNVATMDAGGHLATGNMIMDQASWMGDRTFFSEIELAIISNRGPVAARNINLGDHFGYSEYRDGQTMTIDQEFAGSDHSYRFTDGTWSSDKMLAVGLHLAGEYKVVDMTATPVNEIGNQITLDADISASGYGGQGIRIENNKNTVTIAEGRTVSANGEYGVGVLVTRGNGTTLNNQGTIEANGPEGIGVWFNTGGILNNYGNGSIDSAKFGNNVSVYNYDNASIGSILFEGGTIYNGSYIVTVHGIFKIVVV